MRIGIVGAGQLARMMIEDASALGLHCTVLAESPDDAAALSAHSVILGAPNDREALAALADQVDVITFDHELVDLELLATFEANGVQLAPPTSAQLYAVDKAAMRTALSSRNLPMPQFVILEPASTITGEDLGRDFGWPLVIKAARGGYDGHGVFVVENAEKANEVLKEIHGSGITALVEEHVEILTELAALVCRRANGEIVAWPVVETAQLDGVCREVLVPGQISSENRDQGEAIAKEIAEALGVVGVLAVELFITKNGLVINELAMRPHNSGHWTQDGSLSSQFENHLRAVIDVPLGVTTMTAPAVASVNIYGSAESIDEHRDLGRALTVPGAHVHLYGKVSRPGRKLGHVTVVGENPEEIRQAAWQAAAALGSQVPDALKRYTS